MKSHTQYEIYHYEPGGHTEVLRTDSFADFAAKVAELAMRKKRGEVHVASKEIRAKK